MKLRSATGLVLASILLSATAAAVELDDYKVQAGDSCESIAKKTLGDAKRCDDIRAANPDIKSPTDKLKAGTTIKVPRPPPDATVSAANGAMNVMGKGASNGGAIAAGSEVTTADNAHGEITYKDGFRVQLLAGTTLWVLGAAPPKGAKKPTVLAESTLAKGALRAHVTAGGKKPLVIATANAKVNVLAGDAKVHVDEGVTRVSVHKGTVTVEAGGKKIEVGEGFGLKVEKGKAPGKPTKLPDAPKWTAPPTKLALTAGEDAKLTAMIGGVASVWQLEIARDDAFNDVVFDLRPKAEGSTLALEQKLPLGRYFARAAALDADMLESAPTAAETTLVAKARVVPSVPGKRATIEVAAGLFCGLDGAPLAETKADAIELAAARAHTLECAASADGAGKTALKVDAKDTGVLTVTSDAAAPTFEQGKGARTIALKVVDPAGTPVEGAEVVATATDGVTIDAPKAGTESGVYVATLHWSAPAKSSKLHFVVNGATTYDTDVALPSAPAAAKTERHEHAPRKFRSEVAVSAGVLGATADLGAGFGASVGVGYRYLLGPGALAASLRLGFERYAIASTNGVRCGAITEGTPCGSQGIGYYVASISSTVFTVGVPISYRYGAPRAAIVPYLTLLPQLVIDHPTETASGSIATSGMILPPQETTDGTARFALSALLGVGIRASGSGTFFLEAGWRFASSHVIVTRDASLAGPLGMIGYRFAL
jgi:hypothetical protein